MADAVEPTPLALLDQAQAGDVDSETGELVLPDGTRFTVGTHVKLSPDPSGEEALMHGVRESNSARLIANQFDTHADRCVEAFRKNAY